MSARVVLLIAVLSCFGCSTQIRQPEHSSQNLSGKVTGGVIDAPSSERYAAEQNAHYEQPLASPDNPLPIYPSALLPEHLSPVAIQVRIVVNTLGNVVEVIPAEQPNLNSLVFVESVRSAVKDWKFTQLVKVVPGPGSTTLTDTFGSETTYSGHATPLSFHLDYRFVFSQSGGKANVTGHSTTNPES